MTDDDHLDLSAWQPPPAPDVADAVIARMHASAAVEPPARTRWWIGGAAIAVVAAAALALWLRSPPDESPPGSLAATRAQHLVLDGASADVDDGATLRWAHDRDGLRVEQRGGATWTVQDRLRIGAGAGSIEATAANLRVEVEMERQDLQLAGSALTAAAVALVTVIVYDGHVRATSAGQTITLAPGTTFQIVPDQPPKPVELVGGGPRVHSDGSAGPKRVACLELRDKRAWRAFATCAAELAVLRPDRGKELADLAASEQASEEWLDELDAAIHVQDLAAAYRSFKAIPPSSVYASEAASRYQAFEPAAIEKLVVTARALASHQQCDEIERLAGTGSPAAATAIRAVACEAAAKLDPFATRSGHTCDADAHKAQGDTEYSSGNFAAAESAFEAGYRCAHDRQLLLRAYQSACKLSDAPKARALFGELPPTIQSNPTIRQICLGVGIDPEPAGACQGSACASLQVECVPVAHVLLDGVDTGANTPALLTTTAGKHKVTLVVGQDRFTFSVVTKAGELLKLSKRLQ